MPRGIFLGRRGPVAIADPPRLCEACSAVLVRRRLPGGELTSRSVFLKARFCSKACMGRAFRARPVKADPSSATAHHHARHLKPPGPCEACSAPDALDVHHRDHDWRNNADENLQRLCRSCHTRLHRNRRV